MSDFPKGDGLGVLEDNKVLARELSRVLTGLRAARGKLRKSDAASTPVGDALTAAERLEKDFKLTRARLEDVDRFILGLSRFADEKKLLNLAKKRVKVKRSPGGR